MFHISSLLRSHTEFLTFFHSVQTNFSSIEFLSIAPTVGFLRFFLQLSYWFCIPRSQFRHVFVWFPAQYCPYWPTCGAALSVLPFLWMPTSIFYFRRSIWVHEATLEQSHRIRVSEIDFRFPHWMIGNDAISGIFTFMRCSSVDSTSAHRLYADSMQLLNSTSTSKLLPCCVDCEHWQRKKIQ